MNTATNRVDEVKQPNFASLTYVVVRYIFRRYRLLFRQGLCALRLTKNPTKVGIYQKAETKQLNISVFTMWTMQSYLFISMRKRATVTSFELYAKNYQ
jgi:hypothetical protein